MIRNHLDKRKNGIIITVISEGATGHSCSAFLCAGEREEIMLLTQHRSPRGEQESKSCLLLDRRAAQGIMPLRGTSRRRKSFLLLDPGNADRRQKVFQPGYGVTEKVLFLQDIRYVRRNEISGCSGEKNDEEVSRDAMSSGGFPVFFAQDTAGAGSV